MRDAVNVWHEMDSTPVGGQAQAFMVQCAICPAGWHMLQSRGRPIPKDALVRQTTGLEGYPVQTTDWTIFAFPGIETPAPP